MQPSTGSCLLDWDEAQAKRADVEARMTGVLDELGLTALVTSIDGLSPVGAAAILAPTWDLARFTSARAVVKHAGLAPRERQSGTFTGRARVTGAGRPGLRVAAWRAVRGCLQTNRVYAARYRHLTTRDHNRLTPAQAQTAVAGAILRQLYAVVVHQQAWDPVKVHSVRSNTAGRCATTPAVSVRAAKMRRTIRRHGRTPPRRATSARTARSTGPARAAGSGPGPHCHDRAPGPR